MKITLNGAEKPLEAETAITTLLESEGYADKLVAVAVNGTFVPRTLHTQTIIKNGDEIEIVAPMQGGRQAI